MRRYLDVLACFPNTPIVYIDEVGIDTYLYRHKARAPRGEKVYDKVSGRRFERISVVAGQTGSKIIAPLALSWNDDSGIIYQVVSGAAIAILDRTPCHHYG